MSEETPAILSIAADRFLTGRYANARDVIGAIARGQDPRAPGHVVCVRDGRLFDVQLPQPDLGRSPSFVACLFRAEHVIGLEERLDAAPAKPGTSPLLAHADDLAVRLWACEAWIEQRSAVRVSERYVTFPRALRWAETEPARPEVDRYLFDYEAAFAPHSLTDDQAVTILEHKGCRVDDVDLDRALDRWVADFGPSLDRDLGH